ncbi:MAG: M3 family oligoendopeptidase [Anaerolineales bacterium]|nr:M3 family oligoendopeptidase [Anaerolineales bacterium]
MNDKVNELGNLPHWDLSNVYPALDSDAFKKDMQLVGKKLGDLDAFLSENKIGKLGKPESAAAAAPVVGELLDRLNALIRLMDTVQAYVYSFISTDSYNEEAKRILSQLEQLYVRLEKQQVQVRGWIGALADLLPEIVAQNETAKAHQFYLSEIAEQSKYMMSEAEEELAAELTLSGGNAWSKLQGTVTSQLTVEFELGGETKPMPITAIINLRSHPDEDVRKRGYEAENVAWKRIEEPLAAAINGIKGEVNTLNQRRGREDALHSSIDQARIDRQTLEAMLSAMKDSFPAFRRYFKAKAARFGQQALPWWNLFAPTGELESEFTYEAAREFIVTQFGGFSDGLAAFAEKAFEHNWIDAEPRDGKRGGAFCMGVPAVDESRILCNFDGSLDQVSTIAHELGHGFHNECLIGKTELQAITPMTLAETASIMCETIVSEAALQQAASPQEELAILETSLIGSSQVIVDIYSRYLFEKTVFERRAEAELSAEDLNELMLEAQQTTYGDGLDERYMQKYMWTWKPHYYSPGLSFYNYPYAFGLLFGTGLYAIYQERGADFVPDYVNLLASTGLGTAANLAARFDIDLRTPEFWQNSLKVIEKQIDRYVALK